ncbi:MAG: CopK family periplasmic copper-binding protein [Polaromonas sp.]
MVALIAPAFAQSASPPGVVKQYDLKDGTTLYVFKDGKMTMENKHGKAVAMKDGQTMETKDGQTIIMKGNEVWRLIREQPRAQ